MGFIQTLPISGTQTTCKQTAPQQVFRSRKTCAWNSLVVRDTALFGHHNSYLQPCSKSSSVATLPFPPFLSCSREGERESRQVTWCLSLERFNRFFSGPNPYLLLKIFRYWNLLTLAAWWPKPGCGKNQKVTALLGSS